MPLWLFLVRYLVSASTGGESSWFWLLGRPWLLPFPTERSGPCGIHCWECSIETSELPAVWLIWYAALLIRFVSKDSRKGNRQTGQVDCFLSHTSIHERWKLCPHLGMIRSTSFSWYSPKQIEHLRNRKQSTHKNKILWKLIGLSNCQEIRRLGERNREAWKGESTNSEEMLYTQEKKFSRKVLRIILIHASYFFGYLSGFVSRKADKWENLITERKKPKNIIMGF